MNFLEQLVAEWLEYQGYFVRRNVHVGRRPKGGYECELDPSMDADSWAKRRERYSKKFAAGRKHIPDLFSGFQPLPEIERSLCLESAVVGRTNHSAAAKSCW